MNRKWQDWLDEGVGNKIVASAKKEKNNIHTGIYKPKSYFGQIYINMTFTAWLW